MLCAAILSQNSAIRPLAEKSAAVAKGTTRVKPMVEAAGLVSKNIIFTGEMARPA
jgi:hypothetical protein